MLAIVFKLIKYHRLPFMSLSKLLCISFLRLPSKKSKLSFITKHNQQLFRVIQRVSLYLLRHDRETIRSQRLSFYILRQLACNQKLRTKELELIKLNIELACALLRYFVIKPDDETDCGDVLPKSLLGIGPLWYHWRTRRKHARCIAVTTKGLYSSRTEQCLSGCTPKICTDQTNNF